MYRKLFAISLFVLWCSVALAAQTKPRLAILPFTGGTGGDGETIAELFSFESEIAQVFTIVPRTSSIDAIMKEQQFQRSSGLTDSDTIARLGRQYNADYVLAGHIQTLGASKLVLITIIHVQNLQQIAGDFKEYKNIEEIQGMIPDMARRIAAASRRNTSDLPRIAVLPFAVPANGVNAGDAEVLAQLLATEVANSGKYAVLPRTTTIQTVMQEHQIQRSGITDSDSIQVIGKALNAGYVLAGSVRKLGAANMFTAQILNVEDGSLVVGSREDYTVIADGLSKMVSLGSKLVGSGGGTASVGPPEGFVRVENRTSQGDTGKAGTQPSGKSFSGKRKWLYPGLRFGWSLRHYTLNSIDSAVQADTFSTFEGAALIEAQIHQFFALQTELIVSSDTVSAPVGTGEVSLVSKTLSIPLLAKLTWRPGNWYLAAFAGPYLTLPLGVMEVSNLDDTYDFLPTFGLTGGANAGLRLGPGVLFLDLRYNGDFTYVRANGADQYRRGGFSVSLGYNFGLIDKR